MMTDLPDNVDLQWLARHLVEFRDETRAALAELREDIRTMRRDMDILIRSVIRLDQTVDALRQDMRDLWLSQGDLRRRIEALESK
jgi:chromosome segregation ATPase